MFLFVLIISVGRSLVYHLSELKGMSLWYDKYGVIGLSSSAIQGRKRTNYAGCFELILFVNRCICEKVIIFQIF